MRRLPRGVRACGLATCVGLTLVTAVAAFGCHRARVDAAVVDPPDRATAGAPAASAPSASESPAAVDAPHDGDADGVVGGEDRCPDAPELVNGVDDGDGCPDVGPFGIRLDERGERIEHDGKIHFGLDGDAIPEEHLPPLAALAEVIQASPGLGVVRVEVHTDPRGSAEYNRLLSQRRAEAIRAALIERGVDGGRLRAIGFGADRPIVCNECDSWALSRRVEFWRDR